MKIDFVSETKLKNDIKQAVRNVIGNDFEIFIFGSRITGNAGERSDIDVGIKGSRTLNAIEILNIQEKLSFLPYLFKFDIVDFSNVNDNFKKVSLKKIEIL